MQRRVQDDGGIAPRSGQRLPWSRRLVLVYQEVDTRLLFVVVKSYHVLVLATPEYVGTSL